MNIKFWTYVEDMCDGSNVVRFFNTQEEAENYASKDDQRYNDDIDFATLEVDEDGKILNVSERDDEND